jgi:RNA recognition motif-containing protein
MDLFVGPLPHHITYSRFKHYFQGFEKHMQVQIRRMTHDGNVITFAFVTAASPRIAKKLIAKFNGRVLHGSPVVVRPFVHRATGNERRSILWRNQPWKFFNRRRGNDRRRYHHITELEYVWLNDEPQKPEAQTEEKKRHIA